MKAINIRLSQLYYRQLINHSKLTLILGLRTPNDIIAGDVVVCQQRITSKGERPAKFTDQLCFAEIVYLAKVRPDNDEDTWYKLTLKLTHIVDNY